MILIQIPDVERIIFNDNKNIIKQFITESESFENCMLESEAPFIINSAGTRIFLSSNKADKAPEKCEYGLLTSKKPTKKGFQQSKLNFIYWTKHPKFGNENPSQVLKSWKGNFNFIKEDLDKGISGLRAPQLGALYSILSHIQNPDEKAIVVMPTGTGKTETMLSTLISNQCKKLLISVPSDSLRDQIATKFLKLGLLKDFNIVENKCSNPIVGIVNKKFSSDKELIKFLSQVNVVVTTMNILSGSEQSQKAIMSEEFSHFFVDEAHHSEAKTWKDFINLFEKEKVFLFTATPFRNDGKNLDGKFIYKFSLRKAQEQGYYKNIMFEPIREYDLETADKKISEKAVAVLKKDMATKFNHILLARCRTKQRAKDVFTHYAKYPELKPILVHTGIAGLKNKINAIKSGKHKIIVCVDMLGEGFDLPELKIAAVHDERQSIPITLQFIGRFTRTSNKKIGDATFVTNTAYPPIQQELDQLYAKGSDWNALLPRLSEGATDKEINFQTFLDGFSKMTDSQVPYQAIIPAMSAVVYRVSSAAWLPKNWPEGLKGLDTYEHQFSDVNTENKTLIIILGKVSKVEWGNFDSVQNVQWDMITIHWDKREDRNLAFVHTSIKSLATDKLIESIFGEKHSIIEGMDVFKIFHEVKRLKIYNFGGRKGIGKDVSFQSFFGKNVEDGIKQLEEGTLKKNNAFGVGYKEGEQVSLGCSVKGKIWSYLRGNLNELIEWCHELETLLIDPNINPNVFLKNTIIPVIITARPQHTLPIMVDWHHEMYRYPENRYVFEVPGSIRKYDLSNSELNVIETPLNEPLRFSWNCDEHSLEFDLVLSTHMVDGINEPIYKIVNRGNLKATVNYGSKQTSIENFFYEFTPPVYFADGSQLNGNSYFIPKDPVENFSKENLESLNWQGVLLNKESQGIAPYEKDSIQYNFIQKVMDDYDIIYDDDGSGEIADVIGINRTESQIDIHLFHLKFAKNGLISNDIENFYQVCGQAQKSLNWKYCEGKFFFDHLLKRLTKKEKGQTCSRLIKGSEDDLELLLTAAKWNLEAKFHIYIVQPGLDKEKASRSILSLLANTSHYLSTVGDVHLRVFTS